MSNESKYSADDRGNVVQFYEDDEIIATLNREGGETADQHEWDGGDAITDWAAHNGYEEVLEAKKVR